MPQWRTKIDLKSILNRYDSDKLTEDDGVPSGLVDDLIAEMKKGKFKAFQQLSELLRACETVRDLNDTLGEIYVAADNDSIWCGL